jgi:hypothetical protein
VRIEDFVPQVLRFHAQPGRPADLRLLGDDAG